MPTNSLRLSDWHWWEGPANRARGGDRLGGGAIVGALLVGKEPLRIPLEDLAGRPYVLLGWQSIWSAVNRPG
ncbi:MAG TPA: hypothetical protein VNO32_11910 [Candidatus Acidoferrum sp.]|nr:hypothetical protein [Candidatus Acidoferrum sp.]